MALVVTLVLGFVATPIILKLLGTSRYGLMAVLTAILYPLGLTTLNFGQATVKYVAEALGKGDNQQAGAYLRTTLLFNLIIGVVGMMTIVVLASWLTSSVFQIAPVDRVLGRDCLYWLAVGWLVTQAVATLSSVPMAFQRYELVTITNAGYSLLSAICSIGILYATGNLVYYVAARTLLQVCAMAAWIIIARSLLPGVRLFPQWNQLAFRRCFGFGIWQTASQLGGMLGAQTDKYVLGILMSTASVGLYDVAMTAQKQAYSLGNKFGEVLFPAFSRVSAENDRRNEASMLMRSTWLLSLLSTIIMVPVIVLAKDFLSLWVGREVAASSGPVLRVLGVAGMLGSASNATFFYLQGVGKTKWNALIVFATGVTVLTSSLLLVPRLGLAGAGWGNIAAMFVQAVLVAYTWSRMFRGILTSRVYLTALYEPVIVGLLSALLGLWIRGHLAYPVTWLTLLLAAAICVSVTVSLVVAANRVMPGGNVRHHDLFSILSTLAFQRPTLMRLKSS